jgi:hypothetical protein
MVAGCLGAAGAATPGPARPAFGAAAGTAVRRAAAAIAVRQAGNQASATMTGRAAGIPVRPKQGLGLHGVVRSPVPS